ncbi:MAG: CPBP family intramembrane glutamic endopeptidase [Bacteroidota bacterium]
MLRVTSLREPLLAFLAAIASASALFWLGRIVPFIHRNLHAFIAVIFFYAPVVAGRVARRPFDFRAAGLRLDPFRLNVAVLALAVVATFPLFTFAFFKFYDSACARAVTAQGGVWLGGFCPGPGWTGWGGAHLRLPPDFAILALNQVLVIALPEELFFRGYLLGRLEARWPPGRRFLGAPVGWALVASAVMFALGHFLVDFNPQRLAVFFPGLVFAWMRARTGSIAAGAAYHALCNLLADVLHGSTF